MAAKPNNSYQEDLIASLKKSKEASGLMTEAYLADYNFKGYDRK